MDEFITDQADVRLHERYIPEDLAQHSDLLHISLCKALYEINALRARIEEVEGMAKMIHADSAAHHLMLHDITRITRAVSAWLKEGK